MRGSTPEQAELDAVWDRVLSLPDRDQYELYERLQLYLEAGPGADTDVGSQAAGRGEALRCLDEAARFLRLPDGEGPTVAQYEHARRELGLPLSSQQIVRRWERWRNAKRAVAGGRVPRSRAQRALARNIGGRRRSREDYIQGVRLWLDSEPPAYQPEDYDDFVDEHNDKVQAGEPGRELVKAQAIRVGLGLGWEDVLAVAHELADVETLRAQRTKAGVADAGPLRLVGTSTIADMLGVSRSAAVGRVKKSGFPPAVATVSGQRAWVLDDIEAFREGRDVPARTEGEMQKLVMDSRELQGIVHMSADSLRTRLHQKRWHLVPPPDGKVNQVHYWKRAAVKRWVKKNRPAKRSPGRPKNPKKSR